MDYENVFNWILLGFISIACLFLYFSKDDVEEVITSKIMLVLFSLFNVIFWGGRPSSVGVDTGNYVRMFRSVANYSTLSDYLNSLNVDYFFGGLIYYLSRLGDVNLYFTGIALFTMLGYYVFFIKITKYHSQAILGLLMLACMFSFTGMLSNIIRNGLAIALFLPCTFYTLNRKYKLAVLWGIASLLSHQSILLPLLALIVVHFTRLPLKYYLAIYLGCSILALANIGLHSFSFIHNLGIIKLNGYINSELSFYRTGFRPDFYAFNTFFLVSFLFLKRNSSIAFDRYLKLFIILSSVFFLSFHIPFSDRFGIYSWVLIPVVLFLGTQSYNLKYRFTISTVATFLLYFINQLIYIYTHVPVPEN